MATHSSLLAWRILWTEEPGGLPSIGSHRVGHNWSDLAAAAESPCSTPETLLIYYTSIKNEMHLQFSLSSLFFLVSLAKSLSNFIYIFKNCLLVFINFSIAILVSISFISALILIIPFLLLTAIQHRFWSFVFPFVWYFWLLSSLLIHWLFRSLLFNFPIFVNFPVSFLQLIARLTVHTDSHIMEYYSTK